MRSIILRHAGPFLGLALGLAATALAHSADAAPLAATIVRTHYGIPHVTAADYASLGYGQAYAYAQDNLCLIADALLTVNGERSKYLGPDTMTSVANNDTRNLDADTYFKASTDLPALRRGFAGTSADYQASVRGWVAGYNRYLRDTPPAKRPAACRDAAWVRPMSVDDVLKTTEMRNALATGGALLAFIVPASPPGAAKPLSQAAEGPLAELAQPSLGSNGWAFGREVTANHSGVLLGNPHFPWEGAARFYEIHLTIPGKLDVMGVINAAAPGVLIGFNKDMAWTHTVSLDRHFTFFQLALDPADPTAYMVDGKSVAMTRKTVSIEVAGREGPQTRTLYSTIYGPVVVTPFSPWTASRAYAVRDANKNNQRANDTWLDIARAHSVSAVRDVVQKSAGLPWVNTIAADRRGDILYAQVTSTPNVPAVQLAACTPKALPALFADNRIFVLDGARSACDWQVVAGAPLPGLTPGAAMPSMIRTDYVANSNDSYWLANPKTPFAAYSPIVGPTDYRQQPRTRAGLVEIGRRLDGSDGLGGTDVDAEKVKAMIFANRDFTASLVLDDLLKACGAAPIAVTGPGAQVDLRPACDTLAKWDRKADVDSVGAVLFAAFVPYLEAIPGIWTIGFDPADPIHTPRGLNTQGPTGEKILQGLATAVQTMKARGVPIDASVGSVQFVVRGSDRIPIPGGTGRDGVLNVQEVRYDAKAGGYRPYVGSSYVQVVTFDADGPVADAILTYSQSVDPDSPHASDQTRLHSGKGWVRLPFSKSQVAAQAEGAPLKISE